jgi:hypothetical protein
MFIVLFIQINKESSLVKNFGHSEVLIRMIYETPLLLDPRNKFVTLNIFDRKFSIDFPTKEDWSTEFVDLVATDGLFFVTNGSFWRGRAGAGVFSDISNCRESYTSGSHVTVLQSEVYAILAFSEYCILEGIGVRLVWVPGHCGIHGNEEADAFARAGSSSAYVGPELRLPLALSSGARVVT